MTIEQQILQQVTENNKLLKEVIIHLQYLKSVDADIRAFSINVIADIFVEAMENNTQFKESIIKNFNL